MDEMSYCMYFEMLLFIRAPVMPIQGKIDERARASLHDRTYARTKPVTKAARKLTTRATFSEIPC